MPYNEDVAALGLDEYKYGFRDEEDYVFKSRKGLDEEIVRLISKQKDEPEWMLKNRLKALKHAQARPWPTWGGDLSNLNFDEIYFYIRPSEKTGRTWDEVPDNIKNTFERLGIPDQERRILAGVGAQYESEVVYHSLKKEWEEQGVIFKGMDDGLREHEELVRQYFGTIVPFSDNLFAAVNTAVWSGGSFVYIPRGVKLDMPLQAYFRINAEAMGQFERTLIIVEEGAQVQYIEGCTAPSYSQDSFHSGVIEIVVKEGARMRYTTIQNWSHNVYNLVTQRARVEREGTMEWVDGNLGCLAEGTRIITPGGVKEIQKLNQGDQVLSYDEKSGSLCFQRVMAKRFSGYQRVHEVSVGERRLRATGNHPFYSYTYEQNIPRKLGRYRLGYVPVDNLDRSIIPVGAVDFGHPYLLKTPDSTTTFSGANQYGSDYKISRQLQSRLNAPEYTTDELMWLLGYWIGDGNIDISEVKTPGVIRFAKVGFSTPVTDRSREKLERSMGTLLLETVPVKRKDGNHLAWCSKEFAAFLKVNGFYGRAYEKRLPAWVYSLPRTQRLAFVAGYIDADGCVIGKHRSFSIKSCNNPLLEDVSTLLVELGYTPRLYTEFEGPRKVLVLGMECTAKASHRLKFKIDENIYPFLSEALCTQAKKCPVRRLQQRKKIGRSNITLPECVEVVKVSVGDPSSMVLPTWDIEVEGTGNFVAEGFIVHNSKLTMKYPSCYLVGERARGEILSIAYAGPGQHQDAGGKVIHAAPYTSSRIVSKSISRGSGRSSYRGLLHVQPGAHHARSNVECDALLLDEEARTDTYPYINIEDQHAQIGHEATVSKIGDEQLFYLMSRGLSEDEAATMVVRGFIEPIAKELPLEYAVELNRLIELEMEGSVG